VSAPISGRAGLVVGPSRRRMACTAAARAASASPNAVGRGGGWSAGPGRARRCDLRLGRVHSACRQARRSQRRIVLTGRCRSAAIRRRPRPAAAAVRAAPTAWTVSPQRGSAAAGGSTCVLAHPLPGHAARAQPQRAGPMPTAAAVDRRPGSPAGRPAAAARPARRRVPRTQPGHPRTRSASPVDWPGPAAAIRCCDQTGWIVHIRQTHRAARMTTRAPGP
jgi:hypothetical protein